ERIGLPYAYGGEGKHRRCAAREERMPAEPEGERRIAAVFDGKGHRKCVVGEIEDLSRVIGKRPFVRALAGRGVDELERSVCRRLLDDVPRAAPSVAVDRMRVIGEIARKRKR